MTQHADPIGAGITRLGAVDLGDEQYAYYADETRAWYLVSADDVRDLGARLLAGEQDAYSLWCAATIATEVRDTDHDRLDQIVEALGDDSRVRYRCQCGTAMGERCAWTGRRDELVHVRWVPASDRGSAQASGTYASGAYATSLYVYRDCAELLRYEWADGEQTDREDPFVRVIGAAYEG